ncbi:MAG: TetR/AcrR family transcriptional regulator [Leptonema illini]|uniref:TetR/AcrR family transcriptional regulator n=1 Tax=Leptonema illini TaxID=183 RepID=A0A833GZ48_9LEPT|nr:MAG: TetR/AcrR family transcriptional regulator [Leptonema illini]
MIPEKRVYLKPHSFRAEVPMENQSNSSFKRARTEQAREQRRNVILDAARSTFFEKGYQNTTIKEITDRAGLSIGTFYLYFEDKVDVYKCVLLEGIVLLENHLRQAVSESGVDSSTEKLRIVARAYLEFYRQNPEYFDIIAVLNLTEEELRENRSRISREIDRKARDVLKFVQAVVREGILRREFPISDSGAAATGLWAILDGILVLFHRRNLTLLKQDLDKLAANSIDYFIEGMKASPNQPQAS